MSWKNSLMLTGLAVVLAVIVAALVQAWIRRVDRRGMDLRHTYRMERGRQAMREWGES